MPKDKYEAAIDLAAATYDREMRQAVERGAALLDVEKPDWFEHVNLGTLDLGSCTSCVLGQLYGLDEHCDGWGEGVIQLFGPDEVRDDDEVVHEHGFDITVGWSYEQLKHLWVQEIESRRAA